jgi:hypothetical protein
LQQALDRERVQAQMARAKFAVEKELLVKSQLSEHRTLEGEHEKLQHTVSEVKRQKELKEMTDSQQIEVMGKKNRRLQHRIDSMQKTWKAYLALVMENQRMQEPDGGAASATDDMFMMSASSPSSPPVATAKKAAPFSANAGIATVAATSSSPASSSTISTTTTTTTGDFAVVGRKASTSTSGPRIVRPVKRRGRKSFFGKIGGFFSRRKRRDSDVLVTPSDVDPLAPTPATPATTKEKKTTTTATESSSSSSSSSLAARSPPPAMGRLTPQQAAVAGKSPASTTRSAATASASSPAMAGATSPASTRPVPSATVSHSLSEVLSAAKYGTIFRKGYLYKRPFKFSFSFAWKKRLFVLRFRRLE